VAHCFAADLVHFSAATIKGHHQGRHHQAIKAQLHLQLQLQLQKTAFELGRHLDLLL